MKMSTYQPSNNKRNLKWEQRYDELKEYKSIKGNSNVPQSYQENPGLGRWVRRQRVDYANIVSRSLSQSIADACLDGCDDLTRYRIRKLVDVAFVFDLKNYIWYKRLGELKEFNQMNGHVRVPQHYTKGERWYKLGLWVRNQRAMYNRLMNMDSNVPNSPDGDGFTYNFLTEERIQLLNDVGFCWDVQEENWIEHFEKLLRFKEEHGFADVPSRYRHDPALSRWVQEQRRNKESLTPERLKRLDELGFVWGNKNDLHWTKNYDAICEFKRKYDTCSVPAHYDDYQLYNWVNNTRRKCKTFCDLVTAKEQLIDGDCYSAVSGLNKKRIDALREIDFCWLPSIDDNGDITIRPTEKKKATVNPDKTIAKRRLKPKLIPVTTPPKEEKKFIPFPWDEI